MKKFYLSVLLMFGFLVYSQEIVINSFSGKVEVEISAGKWVQIEKETKLSTINVISTGLNSNLVLLINGKIYTIKAMQKGTVQQLTSEKTFGKSGITLGAKVTESDIKVNSDTQRTNISTASTRASDATKDLDWAE